MESPEALAIRRALSAKRTETINTVSQYPAIRARVLRTLARLHRRLQALEAEFHTEFSVDRLKPLVRFYMKGGNAFKCIVNPSGPEATAKGGGNSDWDTQIIVDPWAPLPMQVMLYARIEDIVRDEMVHAGVKISKAVQAHLQSADFPLSPGKVTVEVALDPRHPNTKQEFGYQLACDKPQTFRTVYDYNRIGLWMNDRRKLTNKNAPYAPGIFLNDAIPPFLLFRLGYTWHAEPAPPPPPPPPPVPPLPPPPPIEIDRPVLMELIDVSLPRRNTVEAVAVWEELAHDVLEVKDIEISVNQGGVKTKRSIPLPNLWYHLVEICTMLCEVADESSRHADKLRKRFDRFEEIHRSTDDPLKFRTLVSAIAGVSDISTYLVPNPSAEVTATILRNAGEPYVSSSDPAFVMARNLMYVVKSRQNYDFDGQGRIRESVLREFAVMRGAFHVLLSLMHLEQHIDQQALSDDLVLIETLRENSYIDVNKVKLSGIRQGIILRIQSSILDHLTNTLIRKFMTLNQVIRGLLPFAHSAIDREVRQLAGTTITVDSRSHNTVRPNGVTYENTLVVFSDGRAIFCITLTSATAVEAPFRRAPGGDSLYCSPAELANQRKLAAALIKEYTVRAALANQYEILKRILPNI